MNIKVIATSSGRLDRVFSKWGISFLVGDKLLFDTFSSPGLLLANMEKMRVDPGSIKYVVISHDHWDHTGGLTGILERNHNIIVYACTGFSNELKEKIISLGASLMEADKVFNIMPHIYTTGEISGMYSDYFISEQSLIIQTGQKLSLVTGCAHHGIVNVIKRVKEHFKKDVKTIIGGFHLQDKTTDEIASTVGAIEKLGVEKVYSTHCTGQVAEALFKKKYGNKFAILKISDIITI